MKKLLLTLLGAAALCGLSPHAAAEEPASDAPLTKTISFGTHNGDVIQYKDPTTGEWKPQSKALQLKKDNAKDTEFVKIGDVIFEIITVR